MTLKTGGRQKSNLVRYPEFVHFDYMVSYYASIARLCFLGVCKISALVHNQVQ